MADVVAQEQPVPRHALKRKEALAAAAANGAASSTAQVGKLHEAYEVLASLDHDYKGHRALAMHKIEAAAKILGSRVGGGGKGHEKQVTSDEGIRKAQSILEGAVGGLIGKPRRHIQEAIHQLTIALRVK